MREGGTPREGIRMVRAKNPAVTFARLLVEPQRSSHPARRVVGGAEVTASRERLWMVGAKYPLPVGKDSLVLVDTILVAAAHPPALRPPLPFAAGDVLPAP